jgi:hypothetical protein
MNAIEIEEAISKLASEPFNGEEFPFAFLMAFGNKDTTIKKLRSGASNKSDVGGVLQTNNVHIKVAAKGQVTNCLKELKQSPATTKAKARYIVATDGVDFETEDLENGETRACSYEDFPNQFGFFLPLAGISTVAQIRESSFDIRATSRLNRLYVELLKDNPEWGTAERSHAMNHFMARLIFCFFAESTDIFSRKKLFIETVEQMSERDSSNTHEVIGEIFRAMDTDISQRPKAKLPRWADAFPYVNGGLFAGDANAPKFSKISRSYLLHIGGLDWTKINPDIFGSMIQAVADDEERGELGMHYTSVPNILKVLNPLFLDDLREKLEEAGDNSRMLLNLRKRIAKIRVFDPACGSGNFLVIAYKQLREIENEINVRRGEEGRATDIPLTNFRGIEIRDFSCEIARLALVIAEYQCDLLYRGQKEALAVFLPLDSQNWITCGNALRIDWLNACPPAGTTVKLTSNDLFNTPLDQAQIDFENEGGETYICGNPPYKGSKWQTDEQKIDLQLAWGRHSKIAKNTDYVCGWLGRYLMYAEKVPDTCAAFVTTNSLCQGQHASEIWPIIFSEGLEIQFAHTSFKWNNLAAHNAGVTVLVLGIGKKSNKSKKLFSDGIVRECDSIGPYLVPNITTVVTKSELPLGEKSRMYFGNMPRDGGHLLIDNNELETLKKTDPGALKYVKKLIGSEELIHKKPRYCLWIKDNEIEDALMSPFIKERINLCAKSRLASNAKSTRDFANRAHRFVQIGGEANQNLIAMPAVSSENREYLPADYVSAAFIISNRNFGLYDAPLWNFAFLVSRVHWVWIDTVCGKLRTDFNYSNTIGWNTFPVPFLTDKNKEDLTRSAQEILIAREAHFPLPIADLYDPEKMPKNLRETHERNDELIERIYMGRRFRNDTERLEKLFELYAKMIAKSSSGKSKAGA